MVTELLERPATEKMFAYCWNCGHTEEDHATDDNRECLIAGCNCPGYETP